MSERREDQKRIDDERIKRIVDQAPPLSPEQRAFLAALFSEVLDARR